jgi:Putative peptidoglycan binding domain
MNYSIIAAAFFITPLLTVAESFPIDRTMNSTIFSSGQCPNITRTLSLGSRDTKNSPTVTELQRFLVGQSYLKSKVTGTFGQATYRALKQFQTKNHLQPTGHTGPLTRAAIMGACTPTLSITQAGTSSTPTQSSTTSTATPSLLVPPVVVSVPASTSSGIQLKINNQQGSVDLHDSEWASVSWESTQDFNVDCNLSGVRKKMFDTPYYTVNASGIISAFVSVATGSTTPVTITCYDNARSPHSDTVIVRGK